MTQSERNFYWVNKLLPFKQGCRRFGAGAELAASSQRITVPLSAAAPAAVWPAALALVWSRHAAAEEVLIAAESAGTPLFHRLSVQPETAVAAFLEQAAAEVAASNAQRDFDLTAIAPLLGLESSSLAPLFEVAVLPPSSASLPLAAIAVHAEEGHGPTLSVAAPLGPAFAGRLARHLSRAAAFLAPGSALPLGQFSLLSAPERAQVLGFQGPARPRPNGLLLHQLFEAQARRSPNATAVVHDGASLTYGELDSAANRLAAHLRNTMGVRPGALVGLVLGRSQWMIAALLGVLKAGATYVPINPRQPGDNVSYMLRNASVQALLIDSSSAASAANFQGELCFLDLELPDLPALLPPGPVAPDSSLAYVIYTSGSTGRPKGVAVEHRSIVNTILWRNEFYGMDEHDTTLQMPSYAFDSSVLDIFCTLASGGKLVIPDEDLRLDAHYLKRIVAEQHVTRCIVTPSYYALLHRELAGSHGLRSITVAGENITLDLVSSHHQHLPGVRLINEYGPTENAVCSTACELHEGSTGVHIGGPIANTRLFVLDAAGRPVPIGVPGEIYLAGVGLARGYINQPELTQERFLPSTIAEFPGRMYKTGDWARWRDDGTLEFLGRVDNQVKIRGFRIELSEIEHVLTQRQEVDMAAVLCKQDARGGKYLAAYVATSRPLPESDLAAWVRGLLPYYMVPDVIRVMARLPLTLNGKVDSAALLRLSDFDRSSADDFSALTPVQEALAAMCAGLLRHGQIGLDDNLFSLGANSLRVMELVTRIRSELNANIELVDIYAHPTVRELSSCIEHRQMPRVASAAGRN